jgi:hypothetical protein
MRRKLLLTSIGGGVALALLAASAVAAPGHLGVPQSSAGLVTLAHHVGGGGHMSMHMYSAGPRIAAPRFYRGPMVHAHNFHHEHHHRRFFVAGMPYYDYYYDDSSCWWSRRYRHWVCPSY